MLKERRDNFKSQRWNGYRILIVEDSDRVRELQDRIGDLKAEVF